MKEVACGEDSESVGVGVLSMPVILDEWREASMNGLHGIRASRGAVSYPHHGAGAPPRGPEEDKAPRWPSMVRPALALPIHALELEVLGLTEVMQLARILFRRCIPQRQS